MFKIILLSFLIIPIVYSKTASSIDLESKQKLLIGRQFILKAHWEVRIGLQGLIPESRKDLIDGVYDDIVNYTEDLNRFLNNNIEGTTIELNTIKSNELSKLQELLSKPMFRNHPNYNQTITIINKILSE